MDLIERKVYLEEADRPPPSYYVDNLKTLPLKKLPFQTPEPEQWMKAPEFVPRFKTSASDSYPGNSKSDGFHETSVNDVTFSPTELGSQMAFQNCVSQPILLSPQFNPHIISPINMVPITGPVNSNGNLAFAPKISQSFDHTIPSIFLRKKKRNKAKTQSMEVSNSAYRQYSNHQTADNFQGEYTMGQDKFDTATENEKSEDTTSKAETTDASSTETVSNNVLNSFDQVFDGSSTITNETITNSEKMPSTMLDTLFVDSYDSKERSMPSHNLGFRPDKKNHCPQFEDSCIQLATYHNHGVHSHIANINVLSDSDSDHYEEDCFEGMNITVNALSAYDDFTFSNIDNSPPTRYEAIHRVLNTKNRYNVDLEPPNRVCCSIM